MLYLGTRDSQRDTWRCQSCKRLMYNLVGGYPAPGAPLPLYLNQTHTMACSVCYEMHTAIDKADPIYWNSPVKEFRPVRPDPVHEHC